MLEETVRLSSQGANKRHAYGSESLCLHAHSRRSIRARLRRRIARQSAQLDSLRNDSESERLRMAPRDYRSGALRPCTSEKLAKTHDNSIGHRFSCEITHYQVSSISTELIDRVLYSSSPGDGIDADIVDSASSGAIQNLDNFHGKIVVLAPFPGSPTPTCR